MEIPEGLSLPARRFVEALDGRRDLPERLSRMALVFRRMRQEADAALLGRWARDLAPEDARVRMLTQWLDRREAPLWHFALAQDEWRNAAYAAALERAVRPGMIVFEIGTGTGLLAMLAARAGAAHVYTCERHPRVAEAAREIVARNEMADRITVIPREASEVDLPGRADLFVAELVDSALLGEKVLALTRLARRRFLKDGAVLLPHTIAAWGCLVARGTGPGCRLSTSEGFDLTPFNRFTPALLYETGGGEELLSEPAELLSFDLSRDESPPARRLELAVTRDGVAEGVLRWIRLDFGGAVSLENRPPRRYASWSPCLHLLPAPRPVRTGDTVAVEVSHDEERIFVAPL